MRESVFVQNIESRRFPRLRPHRSRSLACARSLARSVGRYPLSLGGAFIADKSSITSPYPPYEIYERGTLFRAAAAIYSNCDAVRTRGSLVNGKQHPRRPLLRSSRTREVKRKMREMGTLKSEERKGEEVRIRGGG